MARLEAVVQPLLGDGHDVVGRIAGGEVDSHLVELDFGSSGAADTAIEGVFLPAQAVSANGQQGFVWVVQEGKAVRRDVKVERVLPGYLRVVEGLSAQDQVVADASLPLKNGTALQVVE